MFSQRNNPYCELLLLMQRYYKTLNKKTMGKKILGLDLGTTSIGWALIETDSNDNPSSIIGMGSRIIPIDSTSRDQFQKGQSISKNKERTTSRTQRKGYNRKQLRKSNLKHILNELGILPSNELMQIPMLELWELRNNAVDENKIISPEQLGRVLYMLNQKRGYQSARSEANLDKKETDYVANVKGRYTQLKDINKTIGQHFYSELQKANINQSYTRVKELVYPREAYIEEFDKIMCVQKTKHIFLTDEIIRKLRNEIIFFQRKLKSQKGLVNVCEFEGFETKYLDKETGKEKSIFTGPKVAPKSSPLSQLCKIWENVNNISIKIKNPEGSKYKWSDYEPTLDEKHIIAKYLSENEILTQNDLLRILKRNKDEVYANKQIKNGIQGNITFSEIKKIIGDSEYLKFDIKIKPTFRYADLIDQKTGQILITLNGEIIDEKIEQEPLYQLWHTIYSIKELDECKRTLIKNFDFDNIIAENLSKLDFNKQAFGNKSCKSIRKILPFLMQGYNYADSCSLAGYNHSNSLTKDQNLKRELNEKLYLLPKNSLRQPVVEKILNQMINVVNAIIDKYGKPQEIRIELARELKQSKDERESDDKNIRYGTALNKEIEIRLSELGIPITKKYIQKYKYIFPTKDKKWKEQFTVNQCIYCGEAFNLSEALTGDNFDVDHIVPKALLFDDSQTNKVLVHRNCNKNKSNTTAYDFIASKGIDELQAYEQRIDDWYKRGILSYSKSERLKVSYNGYLERKAINKVTESDKKIWENFIDRQLRETAYISRKAKEILNQICTNVYSTEGTVTAKLRELWGWDDVLMNLQFNKYKELGYTEKIEWTSEHGKYKHQKEVVINWTKRDDHRHHAIDALVIACTKQGFIQRINTLNSDVTKDEMNKNISESAIVFNEKMNILDRFLKCNQPKNFTTKYIEQEASKILISFKAGKKVNTKGVRKIVVNDKKKIIQRDILVPRGQLHEYTPPIN